VVLHEVAEHTCVGCYKLFPGRPNKIRCKPWCGDKRRGDRHTNKKRPGGRYKRIVTHFIAIDGEGVTVNGEHHYVLLSVGDKSLHKNGQHLSYEDVWAFLWDCFL